MGRGGNHTLNEQARTHWNGRGRLREVVLVKSAGSQGCQRPQLGLTENTGLLSTFFPPR